MIVDAHVHILDTGQWPDEWWDYVAADWTSQAEGRRPEQVRAKIEPGLIDPDGSRMIEAMDAAGVDWAVNLPIDWGPDFHNHRSVEEIVGHAVQFAARYPDRLIPFGGIDPRREGAADALERWLRDGAIRGLKLYPSCGFRPSDPRAVELYELCAAYGVPILFHTGDPLPLLDPEYSHPRHLREVVRAFPDLSVWLGHAGAPNAWESAVDVVAASNAACLELSVWLWDDSTADDELALARRIADARDRVGIERILFGSDHVSGRRVRPRGFLNRIVEMFERLPDTGERAGIRISPEELDLIMGGNAARILELDRTAHAPAAERLGTQ